jgi:hypothetical protein
MSRIAESMMPGPYNGLPGYKEPTTSKDAARAMASKSSVLRDRVLAVLTEAGDRGLTPDEAAVILGEDEKAIRPRFTELGPKHEKRIIETGERRINESGLRAKAWRLAP